MEDSPVYLFILKIIHKSYFATRILSEYSEGSNLENLCQAHLYKECFAENQLCLSVKQRKIIDAVRTEKRMFVDFTPKKA